MTQVNRIEIAIAIGADHRGFLYKKILMSCTQSADCTIIITWHDVGAYDSERSDYPGFAQAAAELVAEGAVAGAVLICGTGIGMAIAANRVPHTYAGVVWTEEIARKAKEDDNVNVLVIPADYVSAEVMQACFAAWLTTSFRGGHYAERLQQIDE